MNESLEAVATTQAPAALGAYSQGVKANGFVFVSGQLGIDPATGELAGADAYSQARQIVRNFRNMLAAVGGTLEDVLHVHVYLKDCADFAEMNRAYAEEFGTHRPARTVIGVADLPKPGARMTMNLTAVCNGSESDRLPPNWL